MGDTTDVSDPVLDARVRSTRRQLQWLLDAVETTPEAAVVEEALAALSLTLEELEVSAEELRAQNDELIAARTELEAERQRFQDLFDLAPEPYLVTDALGVIRIANRQADRLLAARPGGLVGKPLAVFVREDDRGVFRSVLRTLERRAFAAIDMHVGRDARTHCPVMATVHRGDSPEGEVELRWLLADAAAHELVRQELSRRLSSARSDVDTLEQAGEWQRTLLGAAAHDLRTPLSVVSGVIETVLRDDVAISGSQAQDLLERAGNQATKLRRVLTGLLEMAQMQVASDRSRRAPVRLGEVVDDILVTLDVRGHRVAVAVDEGLIASVDRVQVERIMDNLLTNALEHTGPDSDVRLSVTATDDDAVRIVVGDRGPGIPDHEKLTVFRPFVRLDDHGGSSGLGLAIVDMFAAYHGGRAWVEDGLGGGATFVVELPNAVLRDDALS